MDAVWRILRGRQEYKYREEWVIAVAHVRNNNVTGPSLDMVTRLVVLGVSSVQDV